MKPSLRNQKGQMTMEAVLLLVIIVAMFTLVHRQISDRNMLSSLVRGPWGYVSGMISNGVWKGGDTKSMHPNVFKRRASPEPI
jgi:hypothetical protein